MKCDFEGMTLERKLWAYLAAVENGPISDEDAEGMCGLCREMEELRDPGLKEVVCTSAVNQDDEVCLFDDAVKAESI